MKTIQTTTRLQIREFIAADADAMARIICDPQTMRFYPVPFQGSDADQWIERNQRLYETDGHGLWGCDPPEDGRRHRWILRFC